MMERVSEFGFVKRFGVVGCKRRYKILAEVHSGAVRLNIPK